MVDGQIAAQGFNERAEVAAGGQRRPLVTRIRFQLPGALLVGAVAPTVLRHPAILAGQISDTALEAAIGVSAAIVFAYYLMRRIGGFPGVQSGAHILFAVTTAFAVILAAFVLFRFDYSRFILAAGYTLTLAWFVSVHIVSRRVSEPRLAVVPGGKTKQLVGLEHVTWQRLKAPPNIESMSKVSGVVADLRHDLSDAWERFLTDCTLQGIPVYHAKQVAESLTGKVEIEHLSENSFGSLLPSRTYIRIKQVIDWLVAVAVLPVFALLIVVVGALIVAESGWPIFYRQERKGYRGALFRVCKFRTMRRTEPSGNATAREAAMTRDGDQRITRVGRILRRYRIDELPQILNILRGEMSWIGPRPEAVALADWYEEKLPFYRYRHAVRPGISGWAQVSQGHVARPKEVLEKLHYDFFYVKYLSPWLDILIVMRTARTVLFGFGAK